MPFLGNYRADTPFVDNEVASVFRGRKRRKKISELWTRRKGSVKHSRSASLGPRSSRNSSTASRPQTSQSMYNLPTYMTHSKTLESRDPMENLRIELLTCCKKNFYDLESFTEHKMKVHKLLDKFWCTECYRVKFTSK